MNETLKLNFKVKKLTSKFKKGQIIYPVGTTYTLPDHGVTREMQKMLFKPYKIEEVYKNSSGSYYYYINGFDWSEKDLVDKEPKADIFLNKTKKELFDETLIDGV